MVKRELKIPLRKVENGVDLCLENASQFCSDARVLCDNMSLDHALASCIFALEELGKAVLLKTRATYTLKESKDMLIFKKEKPEEIYFNSFSSTYLSEKGYCWKDGKKELKEVNPFFDHLSKLLYASHTLYIVTHRNVVKSIEDRGFESDDEMDETINNLLKEAYELNVYDTDFRELALYVDYDQEQSAWKKGSLKLSQAKLGKLLKNIEDSIKLTRYGNL